MMNGRFEFCEYVMKIATVKEQYIKKTNMSKIYLIVVDLVAYMQLVQLFLFLWRISILIMHYVTEGPVPGKTVKFNLGLSQMSSTVFLSKNMQLEVAKYC